VGAPGRTDPLTVPRSVLDLCLSILSFHFQLPSMPMTTASTCKPFSTRKRVDFTEKRKRGTCAFLLNCIHHPIHRECAVAPPARNRKNDIIVIVIFTHFPILTHLPVEFLISSRLNPAFMHHGKHPMMVDGCRKGVGACVRSAAPGFILSALSPANPFLLPAGSLCYLLEMFTGLFLPFRL
jgi:hypothetical protein